MAQEARGGVAGELTALQGLSLSKNNLTGPLPDQLAEAASLAAVDLSNNRLTGGLEDYADALPVSGGGPLQLLLGNNSLTGMISPSDQNVCNTIQIVCHAASILMRRPRLSEEQSNPW